MLVSPVVRNKALAAGAARWLDELPGLIAGLERDWGITVRPPYPDATEAFVAEAGPASVLKLMIPRDGDHASNEITVLRLAGGDGCVRLLRATADLLARLAAFGDHLYPLQRGAAAAHSHAPRYIGLRYSVGRYRVRRHNRERAMRTQGRPT
jgi:hypothetical protein